MGVRVPGALLSRWLALPLTAGCDLDDPRTTALRRRIIESKPFLKRIYQDWYDAIATALPREAGPVLEIGSGAGFMRERIARVIRSDIMWLPGLDLTADATRLPFRDGALAGVAMTNVFHHIPDPRAFLAEAARCTRPGGALVLIEPWVTPWSTFVYRHLHHEPFDPSATAWSLSGPAKAGHDEPTARAGHDEPPAGAGLSDPAEAGHDEPASSHQLASNGPLSGANGALPWIVFERDRTLFEREFPSWQVTSVAALMPFRYVVSGGVSLRSLSPGFSYPAWCTLERALARYVDRLGMFARIVVTRTDHTRS